MTRPKVEAAIDDTSGSRERPPTPAQLAGLAAIYETGPFRVHRLPRPCSGVFPRQIAGPPGLHGITFDSLVRKGWVKRFAADRIGSFWCISQRGIEVLLARRPAVQAAAGSTLLVDDGYFLRHVKRVQPRGSSTVRLSRAARDVCRATEAAPARERGDGVVPLARRINGMLDMLRLYTRDLVGSAEVSGWVAVNRGNASLAGLLCRRKSYDADAGSEDAAVLREAVNALHAGATDVASPLASASFSFTIVRAKRRPIRGLHVARELELDSVAEAVRAAAERLLPPNLVGQRSLGVGVSSRTDRLTIGWHDGNWDLGVRLGGPNSLRLNDEALRAVEAWRQRFADTVARLDRVGFGFYFEDGVMVPGRSPD